jgi:hypothetical protein
MKTRVVAGSAAKSRSGVDYSGASKDRREKDSLNRNGSHDGKFEVEVFVKRQLRGAPGSDIKSRGETEVV